MQTTITLSAKVIKSPRNKAIAEKHGLPSSAKVISEIKHDALPELTDDFNIGCIVGPSGSGKTSAAYEKYGFFSECKWDNQSIVDCFSDKLTVKEVCAALSSVGLSSPPTWLQPYNTLSVGQKFRADLARHIIENDCCIIDEYSSTVDREVAKFCSATIAKYVKRLNKKIIIASCHYDILNWIEPDWVLDMATGKQINKPAPRKPIDIYIGQCDVSAWNKFKGNHYLSADIHRSVKKHCWGLWANGILVSFYAVIHFPHARVKNYKKGHRLVTLPDYQGFGFGNLLADTVAHHYCDIGFRFRVSTSHPAMIARRAKSPLWKLCKQPKLGTAYYMPDKGAWAVASAGRTTASFEYVGNRVTRNK